MMLRSSSTPVLGSLLSPFSDTPNNIHHQPEVPHTTAKHPPTTTHQNYNKLCFHRAGSQNFSTFSCNSSPISPSVSEFSGTGRCSPIGFSRAQSEGNLEGLANAASGIIDEFSFSNPLKKCSRRATSSFLETIPSFSFHKYLRRYEEEDGDEEDEEEEEEREQQLEENGELFGKLCLMKQNIKLNEEMGYGNVGLEEREEVSPHMYLARGLGVSGVDIGFGSNGGFNGGGRGGGGGFFTSVDFGRDDGDSNGIEDHFKRMVVENPGNPLFLRNYAQFLHQSKGNLERAEEYYTRAILADPGDGEILSQYAKLVWELHRDRERTTSYFERAVQAASEDSHVHAAYASFLWEAGEDEDEDDALNDPHAPPLFHKAGMASVTA
ncbi:unnamed protein product [Ilex paraguariensis]|uniref:Uncharacterized protein n=1 Tax=Ilex paraguariensis TaxID=185542 RepID=A0ABC8QLN6_9AQUA